MSQENDLRYQPFPLSPFLRDAQRIHSALGEGFGLLEGAVGPQQLLDNIISILKSGVEVASDIEEELLDLGNALIEELEEFGGIPPPLPYQIRQWPWVDGRGR